MKESNAGEEGAEAARQHIEEQAQGFLAFTGVHKPPANAIFLLVMGMTGSGKSSFISACTGRDVVVGHGLQSCTSDVAIFEFTLDDRRIYLIDTPGFNDTHKSDAETLATVATYLGTSYAQGVYIHGILYLHRIADNRVGGSARRNIEMLKALVGEAAYGNVAVVTTMWGGGRSPTTTTTTTTTAKKETRATLLRREGELRTDRAFFAELIGGGASLVRHGDPSSSTGLKDSDGLRASALSIVRQLISQCRAGPAVLLIQHELVEEKKPLEQTSAGAIVLGDLQRMAAEYRVQLAAVQKEILEEGRTAIAKTGGTGTTAIDGKRDRRSAATSAAEMAELKADFQAKLAATEAEQKVLSSELEGLQRREQEVMTEKLEAAEQRFRDELEVKEKRLRELERALEQARNESSGGAAGVATRPRPRTTASELAQQVSSAREKIRKERRALEGLSRATLGIKEGMLDGFATSVSSAVVTGVVTAVASAIVCVVM